MAKNLTKKLSPLLFLAFASMIPTLAQAQYLSPSLRSALESEAKQYQQEIENAIERNTPSQQNVENHIIRPGRGDARDAYSVYRYGSKFGRPITGATAGAVTEGIRTCVSCQFDDNH